KRVATAPVTVKCRIGVDEQEPEQALPELISRVLDAGSDAIWIHARKACLKCLSPKENRDAFAHRFRRQHKAGAEGAR
ncbi:tRNA-dihydrouridine synthase, partial [Rhizobium leguminosarum]|uniref:tRNA-dihydrouridine synthase n=1 Tax=Rhizobium leguminosarum TaxID=384 RepID=UPI003F9C7124